ncbi:MAG TPA: NUDIX hydrolase [Candidatus Saccharimonadales bacterium]|jgi:8-oxo-dGTP pyrophosphatase MutT (NUDIX family)
MDTWKTVSSRQLLDHPRIQVYEDTVLLPDGTMTDYMHFGMHGNDAATVVAVDDDKKILIQKEYSYPPNEWLYQFPGGMIEDGESPEEGALRELAEEGGYSGDLRKIGWFYLNNRREARKMHVFIATGLHEAVAEADPGEVFMTYWLTRTEIDRLVTQGECVTGVLLATWALFNAHHHDAGAAVASD